MTYAASKKTIKGLTTVMTRLPLLLLLVGALQVGGCKGDPGPTATAPNTTTTTPGAGSSLPPANEPSVDVQKIRASMKAINERKWEDAAGLYDPRVTWRPGGHPSATPLASREAVVQVWRDLAQWLPDLTVMPRRIIHAGNRVIVETWTGGTTGPTVRSLGLKGGAEVGTLGAEVLTFENGKVVNVESYGDGASIRLQMQGKGEPAARPAADVPAKTLSGEPRPPNPEFLKAEGLEDPEWASGIPGLWLIAKGTSLWLISTDPAGSVAKRLEYRSVL